MNMSDDTDDFLKTRLEDINVEGNESSLQEEAVRWKCWGRGGRRPPLAKLNFERFVEISRRNDIVATDKLMLPPVENKDSIMKDISEKCHDILGNPRTDRNIVEWLQQSFSETVEHKKQTNESLQELLNKGYSFTNNDNTQLRSNDIEQNRINRPRIRSDNSSDVLYTSDQANNTDKKNEDMSYLSMQKTTDYKASNSSHHTQSNNFMYDSSWIVRELSFMDKQGYDEMSSDLNSYRKRSIKCIPKKNQTFTIENLPRNITRNDVMTVLDSFGTVENVVIIESEEGMSASVRMGEDSNCLWIMECLNDSQPFGGYNS